MTQIGDSSEVAPGTRFGPFRVVRLLGRGGMGTTYLAEEDSGREVVVKTIRAELSADPAFRARFRREAEAARLFRSTLVARVWGFDCEAELPWIALERIDGPTLNEVVDSHGPLPDDRLFGFAADVADAVHAFFDQGLAHGDLTPANVVLQDGERLKILDLGLTRPTVDEAVTSEGPVFGTPYWEAPEVAAGFHPDSMSDVNQWAKLVLFAGTGYPRRRRPLRAALDLLPVPLRQQVERCLQPVPEARLDPQELWRVTRLRAMGRPEARDVLADPGPPLAVSAGEADTRKIDPPVPAAAIPVGTRRRRPWWLGVAVVAVMAVLAGGAFLALRSTPGAAWSGDSFGGPGFDQSRWSVELEHDARVTARNGAVFILQSPAPPGAAVSATLASICAMAGDFDVEVGYRLDTWPTVSGARVGLLAGSDAVERISDPDGEFYAGQVDQALNKQATTDTSGYLRLVRSGTSAFGYTRAHVGDPWQQVFISESPSLAADHINFKVWTDGPGTPVQVTLQHFKVNGGRC